MKSSQFESAKVISPALETTTLFDASPQPNLTRLQMPIGPRYYIREFFEGFDSAGGGWRHRVHALAILVILIAAVAQHALTRWILAATGASMLIIAAAAWIRRRTRGLTQGSEAK